MVAIAAVSVYLVVVLRAAWVSDDSFITMRTVDNWLHGYGLRWNTGERVQAYTHPLWMGLLTVAYALLGDPYFAALLLGVFVSVLAVVTLVYCVASDALLATVSVAILTASRAFIDFSTSGLENPLLHMLLAVFVVQYVVRATSLRSVALVVALIAVTRLDVLLLVAPALLDRSWGCIKSLGWRRTLAELLIGLSPFMAWEIFSVLYYGVPFPNTAYAKLGTGISNHQVVVQGGVYLLNTLGWDPLAFAALFSGLTVAVLSKERRRILLASGVMLYLLYVVRIGGDFMVGRFLTAPVFVAVCLFARQRPVSPPQLAALGLPFALLLLLPQALEKIEVVSDKKFSGVLDERIYYREASSLMLYSRTATLPKHKWVQKGRQLRSADVATVTGAGFTGFYAGSHVHLVDEYALTDAFLARLPVANSATWRVGHYSRELPPGYLESLRHGDCQMSDERYCELFNLLRLVHASDLWSFERFKAIVRLNLGRYPHFAARAGA